MAQALPLTILLPILGVIGVAIFNKFIRSSSEVSTTKVAQMELLHKLLLERTDGDLSLEGSNARNHLLQEAYIAISGFNLRLDTVQLLQKCNDKNRAIWVYKEHKLALKHDQGDSFITFTKMGPNIVALLFALSSIFSIACGTFMVRAGELFLNKKDLAFVDVFNGVAYSFVGISLLVMGVLFIFKAFRYIKSRAFIRKELKGAMEDSDVISDTSN